MKKFVRMICGIILLQIIFIGVVIGTSNVQDMTLATDDVVEIDDGWSLVSEDGTRVSVMEIPYYGKSDKYEKVTLERKIDPNMCGKTLSFLSADKNVRIYAGRRRIYSFGVDDIRKVGHTPGSVMVFADIPEDSEGETLYIKMQSPYRNFASYITKMVAGNRDITILYFIKNNAMSMLCSLGIVTCGIIIIIFSALMRKSSHSSANAMFSIGMYFIVQFIYNFIETKMPMIFYGNQVLYSNLVFISLMMAPFFIEWYMYSMSDYYKKGMKVLMIVTGINICTQFVLQGLNIVDFMNMSFVSHTLLTIVIAVVLLMEIKNVKIYKKIDGAFVGILVVAICGVLDLVRCYTVKVGDLGRYSRIGVFVFGICMVITFMRSIITVQVKYAENVKSEAVSAEIINTLITAIDAKDIYTKGHSTRVANYSVIMAGRLGMDDEQVKQIRYKALLHDVGKIGIPDRVLNKADSLTDEEFDIIKSHTTIGADMLKGMSSLSDMYLVARNHHERYDGKGYPDGLEGESIPIEARIVGIADAYDAMSSDRAYRKALSKKVIRGELIRGRGNQFDPKLVDVFIELFDEGAFDIDNNDEEEMESLQKVTSFVNNMISNSFEPGAIKMNQEDMGKLYQYINGVHSRYGMEFYTIMVTLGWDEDVSRAEIAGAMKAMEYSIQQSLRTVDVMTRVSESQYLVLLTEAREENIQMIVDRIFASFFKNCSNTKFKPSYDIQ